MTSWIALPLVLQGLAMLVDELHFHRLRGLPRWERIGHPIDTLSVLACYGLALALPPTDGALTLYVLVAALSCLLITKDELVHSAQCQPSEQWLHSVLFVLHPIVLGVAALLWLEGERSLLWLSASLTLGFGLYQTVYWNTPWTKRFRARPPSTTTSTTSSVSDGMEPTTIPSRSSGPNPDSGIHG